MLGVLTAWRLLPNAILIRPPISRLPILRRPKVGVVISNDVRARRDIEAARAEDRQSIRLLLAIQAALLVLLAAVPNFAAPYRTVTCQIVMVVLLSGTALLLVWMRHLSLGRPAPRFFGSLPAAGDPR